MTDAVRHTRLDRYLAEKLRADGYGGLCGDDCGCECDDLMPCDAPSSFWCRPGYKHECDDCPRTEDDCPVEDGGAPGGFCVGPTEDYPKARDDD